MGRRRPAPAGALNPVDRRDPGHLRRHRAPARQRRAREARSQHPRRAPGAPRGGAERGRPIAVLPDLRAARAPGLRTQILHERYAKPIFHYCLRHLRSREEAEDAAQLVFLNAHRSLEQGIEPQSEQAWLYKIAEHVVMYRRRTIARRARVEFPIDMNVVADLVASPGRDGDPEPNGLSEALARLPEAERRAIVLREWCGLSYREVAVEIGVSTSAAEKLIVRARRRLAEELAGPQPTLRRRALSTLSRLTSLKWFLGGGTTLKALVGATSIAVLAVGSGRVVLQRQQAASPAASAAPHAVLAMRAGASAPRRHAVAARLRAKVPAVAARPATPEPAAVRVAAPAVPDSELTGAPEEPVATVAPEEQADREVTADPPAASGEATTAAPDLAPVEDASEVVTTPPAESSVAPDVSGLQVLATETDAPAAEEAQ